MHFFSFLAVLCTTTAVLASPVSLLSDAPYDAVHDILKREESYCFALHDPYAKPLGQNLDSFKRAIKRWCSGNGGSGKYDKKEGKSGYYRADYGDNCIALNIVNKYDTPASRTLSSANCESMLLRYSQCANGGGEDTNDGWKVMYVPFYKLTHVGETNTSINL